MLGSGIPETAALALVTAIAAAVGWAIWRALSRAVEIFAEALAHLIVQNLLAEPRVIDAIAVAVAERLGLDPPTPRPPGRG